jgi:hypothetical protein
MRLGPEPNRPSAGSRDFGISMEAMPPMLRDRLRDRWRCTAARHAVKIRID